jgi:Mrp family chromosome partitioning ATPase
LQAAVLIARLVPWRLDGVSYQPSPFGKLRLPLSSVEGSEHRKMKGYHDIVGDGGSRILEQVAEQRTRITDGLAGVRHLVAVGSGKGGVGKSTLTLHLAGALRARGLRIAILDADFNGPSQARMAGVEEALFVPGSHKVLLRGPGMGSRSSRWAR